MRVSVHQSRDLDSAPALNRVFVQKNTFIDQCPVFTWLDRVKSGPDRIESTDFATEERSLCEQGARDNELTNGPTPDLVREPEGSPFSSVFSCAVPSMQPALNMKGPAFTSRLILPLPNCCMHEELLDQASTNPRPSPRSSTPSESSLGTWIPLEDGAASSAQMNSSLLSLPISEFSAQSSSSPESMCTSPALSATPILTPSSSDNCTDTLTCHMTVRDRHNRCRKRFVQNSTVLIHERKVSVKLHVYPCAIKQRSRDLCFRSPNAGLKLELRAHYADAGAEEQLGSMDMVFSVEADTFQEVCHTHDFCSSSSPLCTCPVIFNPPDEKANWVVRVKLMPSQSSLFSEQAMCELGRRLSEITSESEPVPNTERPPYRLMVQGQLQCEEHRSER